MHDQPVRPERITKPIQLLGAWLAGLLSIDGCILFAATHMSPGSWHASALVIAAILNVPLFLAAVFLLQTRFRPELQEDSYYSTYLSSKTNEIVRVGKVDSQFVELRQQIVELENKLSQPGVNLLRDDAAQLSSLSFGVNRYLADKEKIQAKLKEIDVIGTSIFGSIEPPPGRNVAISDHLPRELHRSIVLLARELGCDKYNFFDNVTEDISEDVLFGSYGTPELEIN